LTILTTGWQQVVSCKRGYRVTSVSTSPAVILVGMQRRMQRAWLGARREEEGSGRELWAHLLKKLEFFAWKWGVLVSGIF